MSVPCTVGQAVTHKRTDAELHHVIDTLELSMLQHPEVLIDMPLVHKFTPGIYIREVFNPAGAFIVTKIHKVEHPFVVLKGRISTFVPEDGGKVQELVAPYIGITKAGTRRVILAHEDTVFITFHPNPTNTQDLDELEALFIEEHLLPGATVSTNVLYRQLLKEKEQYALGV